VRRQNHLIYLAPRHLIIRVFTYNLMLNSRKKIRALRDKKNKYSNTRVVRKKNSERNKKP
jgi:hypothetical protein